MAKTDDSPMENSPVARDVRKLSRPSFAERSMAALDTAYSKFSPKAEAATSPVGRSGGRALPEMDLGESMPEPKMPDIKAEPPTSESEPPPEASAGATPGVYKAEGDPYTYEAAEDGSIWIADGPSGRGMQVKPGSAAHAAILGQMRSGVLVNETPTPDLGESPQE